MRNKSGEQRMRESRDNQRESRDHCPNTNDGKMIKYGEIMKECFAKKMIKYGETMKG